MSKLRVYELAKELGMNSSELVEKLKNAGFPINNYMSALGDGDLARAKDYLSGATSEIYEEKRLKPTVIRRRKKIVAKVQEPITVEEPTIEEEAVTTEETTVVQEPILEEEPKPSVEEVVSTPEERAEEVPKEEEEEKGEGAESEEERAPEKPLKAVEPKVARKKKKERPKTIPARIIKMPDAPPPEQEISEPRTSARVVDTVPPPAEVVGKGGEATKRKRGEREEVTPKKEYHRRRREVIERKDLYGDRALSYAGRAKLKQKGKTDKKRFRQTEITTPKAIKRRIKVPDVISVAELAKSMGVKAAELIRKLMELNTVVSINQPIDFESAALVASEFDYELEPASFEEGEILSEEEDKAEDLEPRPPVITIMGHVDHGKTSLLDYIRKSRIIDKESGGITQHIGAYYVQDPHGDLVFLDTPGHEAFTAMRARGAQVTDLIILVVAAEEGVKEQTVEAIAHAKAANVPIIVAVNKIDKPNANPEKAIRELSTHGLLSEEWGGDTLFCSVSAKTGQGVDELLESVLLQAEILELKANDKRGARGAVIEAKLDKNRGPAATILIRNGTLKQGDFFVCGENYGRIRAMINDRAQKIKSASPSMPVEIYGISGVPMAGDDFTVVSDEKKAKLIVEHRHGEARKDTVTRQDAVRLDNIFDRIKEGKVKELNIIVKADVQGSLEALIESLVKLSTDDVKLKVIHGATGAVTESDIMLASASEAIIICFNLRANPALRTLAEKEHVDVRFYDVIYRVIEDVRSAMVGLLEPIYTENTIGRAEVKEVFHVSKVGTVAGSYVTDGRIERSAKVRLLRDDVIIYDGQIRSLKRFKDDAKEVSSGFECGVGLENYNDIKPGDVLEAYTIEEKAAEL